LTIDKSIFLKTVGWTAVGIGLYLVGLGVSYEGESVHINPKRYDDDILDAEFTIIED
jgi:hypothetical protein